MGRRSRYGRLDRAGVSNQLVRYLDGSPKEASLALRLQRGPYGSHDSHAMETGAAFWHMVDLLWIVLFPLVYVLR